MYNCSVRCCENFNENISIVLYNKVVKITVIQPFIYTYNCKFDLHIQWQGHLYTCVHACLARSKLALNYSSSWSAAIHMDNCFNEDQALATINWIQHWWFFWNTQGNCAKCTLPFMLCYHFYMQQLTHWPQLAFRSQVYCYTQIKTVTILSLQSHITVYDHGVIINSCI